MADKKKSKRKNLIPVWVHDDGVMGYLDEDQKRKKKLTPNSYGYVTEMVEGTQPAATDPMQLKSYIQKRRYQTRQLKAEE